MNRDGPFFRNGGSSCFPNKIFRGGPNKIIDLISNKMPDKSITFSGSFSCSSFIFSYNSDFIIRI